MPSVVRWRGRGNPKRREWMGEMREEGGAMNKVMFSEETVVGRYHSVCIIKCDVGNLYVGDRVTHGCWCACLSVSGVRD